MKSYNAIETVTKTRAVKKKTKNKNRSNWQKKNNFARAAHFLLYLFCRCFARLQRETSTNFLVTRFMEEMWYVFLIIFFSLQLIFTLVTASISHFLTAAIKSSCFSSTEIDLRCFFISRSSFCLFRVNVDIQI